MLDCCIEEEGGHPFHQCHLDRVKQGGTKQAVATPLCQGMSPSLPRKVNPLWRMRQWLEECEEKVEEGKIDWWLLVHPLMDGSDEAVYILA